MSRAPVQGYVKEFLPTRLSEIFHIQIMLYRVLDSSLLASISVADFIARLSRIIGAEQQQGVTGRVWMVGHFMHETWRAEVIACLERHHASWIEVGENASECKFSENGLFLPDQRLLSFAEDMNADTANWIMVWPWYCGLPAYAEQDLLIDLHLTDHLGRHEALLRESSMDSASCQELGFVWSGKTLAIFPREYNGETQSLWSETPGVGRRAGWALDIRDIGNSYQQCPSSPRFHEQSETPEFHFGICLRSRACTHDWPLICQNLERTLYNLSRQRCRNFRVWIAVHERPDIETFDLNVEFVIVEFAPPVRADGTFGNDKRRKRNAIGCALKEHVENGFYYMQLDADDLLDISLVQCVIEDDNRNGYLIEKGYIFDHSHNIAARCDENSVPFWQQCGSCAVLYFEPDDFLHGEGEESYFERQRFHEYFLELSREKGRIMTHWVDEAALYLVNHGENQWSNYRHEDHHKRANSKIKFVHRHQMQTPADMHGLFLRYPELVVTDKDMEYETAKSKEGTTE